MKVDIYYVQPLNENRFVIPKSRYESVERYMSNHWYNRPEYNDMKPLYDEAIYERLSKHGMSMHHIIPTYADLNARY